MKISKIILVLILLTITFIAQSSLISKPAYSVTFFDKPPVSYESPANHSIRKQSSQIAQSPIQQKVRAPEPTTIMLFLGGIAGIIVRFVRKSFVKFKRFLDLILSISGMLICAPILILAAILIKLHSRGPIIYKQNRVGKNGNIFRIYKLRSMCLDAEKETGAVWARTNDPRVTTVGRLLRKTHIDEIPQLLNVIKGEMSIVGPRPERPEMVRDLKKLIHDYEMRMEVKPGITGLAQVWHKYDETIEDVKKKIKYDVLYIKKMCLLADLQILAQTFRVVLTGKGAK